MGKISMGLTMSLDGFIAGVDDDVSELFTWYSLGDTDVPLPGPNLVFKVSSASADLLNKEWSKLGALVTGRRDFDVSNAWGGKALLGVPTFIVTHNPPSEWNYPDSPFTFVTDGVESAIKQAQAIVGDKTIGIGGSTIIQQCLKLGLLDEINIHLVPIILGKGIRLFDNLDTQSIQLENTQVLEGTGVTHLIYRVIKS